MKSDYTTFTSSKVTMSEMGSRVFKSKKCVKKDITPFTPTAKVKGR
jgi:hypothetical protein